MLSQPPTLRETREHGADMVDTLGRQPDPCCGDDHPDADDGDLVPADRRYGPDCIQMQRCRSTIAHRGSVVVSHCSHSVMTVRPDEDLAE